MEMSDGAAYEAEGGSEEEEEEEESDDVSLLDLPLLQRNVSC